MFSLNGPILSIFRLTERVNPKTGSKLSNCCVGLHQDRSVKVRTITNQFARLFLIAFIATKALFACGSAEAQQFGAEPILSFEGSLRVETGDPEYLAGMGPAARTGRFQVSVDVYEEFCIVKIQGFPDFYGKVTQHPNHGAGCEFSPLWNVTMHVDLQATSLVAMDPRTTRTFFKFVGGYMAEQLDSWDRFQVELWASGY
jgi:hypothetical protein